MKMFIRAAGNISPQKTFGNVPFLSEIVEYTGSRLSCIEPDYKDFIDIRMMRRMSRIIRLGVASAFQCLKDGGIDIPDAIITGTAYGCLQDTDHFLTKMVEQDETLLTPTTFIQSTHNTIGAQIGLMLKTHNYNNAFVHRGFSFESALTDGMLLLKDQPGSNILVGAIDEITENSHDILRRFGLYKSGSMSNLNLLKLPGKGTMAGEGSVFFLLSDNPGSSPYAEIKGLETVYNPQGIGEIKDRLQMFLAKNNTSLSEIDLLVSGRNGDLSNDKVYNEIENSLFRNTTTVHFKQLCGEYPTASSFGMWLAAGILKNQTVPVVLLRNHASSASIKSVLLYNHYLNKHHSFQLLSAC